MLPYIMFINDITVTSS